MITVGLPVRTPRSHRDRRPPADEEGDDEGPFHDDGRGCVTRLRPEHQPSEPGAHRRDGARRDDGAHSLQELSPVPRPVHPAPREEGQREDREHGQPCDAANLASGDMGSGHGGDGGEPQHHHVEQQIALRRTRPSPGRDRGVRTTRSLRVAPSLRDRLEVRLRTRRPWVAAQPFTRLAGPPLFDALPPLGRAGGGLPPSVGAGASSALAGLDAPPPRITVPTASPEGFGRSPVRDDWGCALM